MRPPSDASTAAHCAQSPSEHWPARASAALDAERLRERARGGGAAIALAEPGDPRVLAAALRARAEGLCRPLLVGDDAASAPRRRRSAWTRSRSPTRAPTRARRGSRRCWPSACAARGLAADDAARLARDPLHVAALLVAAGEADGAVMGAVATTAETLRAALRTVGPRPGLSLGLVLLPDGFLAADGRRG